MLKKIDYTISVLFLLINLHIIRVLNIYFGLIIYLLYALIIFFIYKYKIKIILGIKEIIKSPVLLILSFFIFYFIIINFTILFDSDMPSNLSLLYLGKVNFTYPIVFILIILVTKLSFYKKLTMIYLSFNIASCLFLFFSVYYQNNTFLQNDYFSFKIRDGLERYSTLYGSVAQTGYSISAALIIVMMLNIKNKYKMIIISILCLGSCLSLSRAGYYNIFLALIIFTIVNPNNYTEKIKSIGYYLLSIFVVSPFILYLFGLFGYYNHFIFNVFKFNIIGTDYYTSINPPAIANIFDRIYFSVFNNLILVFKGNLYSLTDLILGYGYQGLGISLGIFQADNIIYIHNGLYEILISGGVIFFVLFLILIFLSLFALYKFDKSIGNSEFLYYNRMFIAALVVILINIILGGSIIHPNLISFFWMIISYVIILQINDYDLETKMQFNGDLL